MKRIFAFALILLACGLAQAADAKFKIGETAFVYTVREGSTTYDLVVLLDNNAVYQGWTDGPGNSSIIAEDFNDDTITAKGGRRSFIDWGLKEALRRAQAHLDALKPPPPDTSHKMDSVVWNIRYNLQSNPVVIPAAPLP